MSDSILQLPARLQYALQRMNNALLERDDLALEAAFEGVNLEQLLSDDTLERVRARSKPALTIFLASLAVSNDINIKQATQWRDAFQSISSGKLTGMVDALPKNNVMRLATLSLANNQPLQSAHVSRAIGGDTQWVNAFELLIDHKAWDSALALLVHLSRRDTTALRWLNMAKVLMKRQRLFVDESGHPQPDVNYLVLAHLHGCVAQAIQACGVQDGAFDLQMQQAKCLEVSQRYDQAIALLKQLASHNAAIAIDFAIARCECKRGDLRASIRMLDAAIPKYAKIHAPQLSEDITEQTEDKTKSFNVSNASAALADLAKVLNGVNQPFFLVSGTLLGYAREGKLMDHDKDVDVGIFGWEQQFDICMALQKSGSFTLSAQFLKGTDSYYIPVMHNLTGMWIDLFLYHELEGQWVTGVDFFFGYRQTFAFTPFELKPVTFLGVDMFVPADIERNMEENFGAGWKQSDPSYISHLESPSTTHKGGLEHMLTARLNVFAALQKRSSAKLRKIATVMQAFADKDCAMGAEQVDWLTATAAHFERTGSSASVASVEFEHV
jgi:tetratricopeptide (TPR) repeat protein